MVIEQYQGVTIVNATDLLIIGIIIGIIMFYNIRKYWNKFFLNRKMKKARKAEKKAATLLEQAGYQLIESQKRTAITTLVNGEPHINHVQADFIVEKQGKVYVVEVKTGDEAIKVTTAATRRQLLEYCYVYKPDGILLLDMENAEMKEIQFELAQRLPRFSIHFSYLLISFALGLVSGVLLYKGGLGQ